ncbi:redox-sensing transcriptional repressor Rex [Zhihengliuella salsuginis]|uniref:Redox-sensing transcriptional repressor Rex n=1 Tax=Zhihengliuella salsuginis TaxID=578222 RepID=A0ABQ3GDZ2_9MICC|nr:redox-sensing transcriptional repressor Rex [Zhihengliuella salsuginis]GHD03037.1 redox-sensing transcriptional repressor Rex [Zhihengliuella salsuginis]
MRPAAETGAGRHDGGGAPDAGAVARGLPEATLERLTVYLRVLHVAEGEGKVTLSSDVLANAAGVNSAILRKDLSLLGGSFGRRGVGYDVARLAEHLATTLGLREQWRVAIVGAGNLGRALAGYAGLRNNGFELTAIFDMDPDVIGNIVNGLAVRPAESLEAAIESEHVNMAVMTLPGASAQQMCDRLVAAGVRNILNFAPVVLQAPDGVNVRKVDMSRELQILAYYAHQDIGHQDAVPAEDVGS